jgi:hypothetical protein
MTHVDFDALDAQRLAQGRAFASAKRREFHRLVSRYHNTKCIACGEAIHIGEEIAWHPIAKACHVACFHDAFDSMEAESGVLKCKCGHAGAPVVTRCFASNGALQLRANCAKCGDYIKFVSHVEPWIGMAKGEPT